MNSVVHLRATQRRFASLLLFTMASVGASSRLDAQCQVLNSPAQFDPPASGAPSGLRPTNDSMGISDSARRLVLRYNYGFVTYTLATPAAPSMTASQSFLSGGYPKSGDGQTRTGKIALSPDGQRVVLPWTDEVGYGTIAEAYSGPGFGAGSDYLPAGYNSNYSAVLKVGSSYLGFTSSVVGVYAANITGVAGGAGSAAKNGIPSEKVTALGTDLSGMEAVESPSRQWIVGSSQARVVVIDATNAGSAPVPGIAAALTWREYSAAELGVPSGSYINNVAAVAHPSDGALYVLVESARYIRPYAYSTFVSLHRVDPSSGNVATVGSFVPPDGQNLAQKGMVLLAFNTDVVAFLMHRVTTGGMRLQVRSSMDFGTNLAASAATITNPAAIGGMVGFRSTGGTAHLYMADGGFAYAMSLDCSTAPGPATALLSVDRIPTTGAATNVPDGGSVFIGDELRVKPTFSPPDSVTPLTDWRLDYDFHEGNALDSQATAMRLLNADESRTEGPALPPSTYTLIGPCDPALVPGGGSAPVPSTGTGCWESVTTNDIYAVSPSTTADFSASAPVDKQLTVALEVQNAFNAGDSSVARHRITWKVPRQLLKSSSILSGGTLEDGSEGSPGTSGYRWYFSPVPVGETGADVLTLEAACTGPTCSPSFTQAGQTSPGLQRPGNYRYWVSVPYRGGFRTAECPGLLGDQVTCSGDAAKTVTVTDVVLSLTAPTSALVGTPALTITSASKKAPTVGNCPATGSGFSYNFCEILGGNCVEGAYTGSGVTVSNPFPTSGTGTLSIPTPSEGTWGLRIRYTYTTSGNCAAPQVAQWPATGWSQLIVVAATPTIRLRNLANTADLPSFNGTYDLTVNVQARAYAYINGVQDASPPALSWSYRPQSGGSSTAMGTAQGQTFSIPTAGDYEITMTGYGIDPQPAKLIVGTAAGGGGGGGSTGGPPTVTSVTASNYSPVTGQGVTFTCNATAGGAPITSYDWTLDYGVTRTTTSRTTSYSYATAGTKTFSCVANDSSGQSSSTRVNQLTVTGGDLPASCSMDIKNSEGARISYDPVSKLYEATSGQPLTFVATGTTGTISWNFGNGASGTGNNYVYTYSLPGSASQQYTVTLASSGCNATASLSIAPSSGQSFLDYSVADAGTGAAISKKDSTTWEATSGQLLKFTAIAATGGLSWDFGDGTFSDLAVAEKAYTAAVDTTFVAKLTNGANSKSYDVFVHGSTGAPLTGKYNYLYVDGTAVNRSAVEPNKLIRFTGADQATTYTWDFGDGSALATGSPKDYAFTRGGTFTVKLTVARDGVPGTATTVSPLAFTVKPPPDPLLWVAAGMAFADGAGEARWQSDLSIFNPGSQTATVSLGFVAGSSWDGASKVTWVQQALVAGETKSYTNVLESLFRLSKPAWGVVLVRGDNVPVSPVIVSRTYNAAFADVNGTFGLSVPAMSVANGVKPQSAAGANVLAGLRHDDAFRTNLTVANLKDEEAQVEIVFRDSAGNPLGVPAKLLVEPRGVKQLNSALSAAPDSPIGGAGYGTPVSHFSAEIQIKKGSGVYPYATVIDMGTNDSIVVTPAPRPSATYRLPGIVRTATWKSDVVVLNPTSRERRVKVTYSYVRGGTTARVTLGDTVVFQPWETKVALDFVKLWLALASDDSYDYASSYVDITPAADDAAPTEPLIVTGKTYTASGTGTSGLQVDPAVFEDGIGTQAASKRILLSGLEANDGFRTNVALFLTPGNASGDSSEVDVNVYDFLGRQLRSIWVKLDADKPVAQLSSNDLFAGLTTTDAERASIIIGNPRGGARVAAYATVIDKKSLDATFVAGQPVP